MKSLLRLTLLISAVGFIAAAPHSAQAVPQPIQGSIDFGGVVAFDTNSLATATEVTMWRSSFVLQDSDDFSSIAAGTHVDMATPWIFNPSTITPSLWSVGGFTFDLDASVIVQQTATFLDISGTGTISGNGFAPTPGDWSFSVSNSTGTDRSTFGFQANTPAVPEPASLTLLGVGGAGLLIGALRRRAARS